MNRCNNLKSSGSRVGIMSFKEFLLETNDHVAGDEKRVNKAITRTTAAKATSVGIQLKINALCQKVKATSNIYEKLNTLADMVNFTAGVSTVGMVTKLR